MKFVNMPHITNLYRENHLYKNLEGVCFSNGKMGYFITGVILFLSVVEKKMFTIKRQF